MPGQTQSRDLKHKRLLTSEIQGFHHSFCDENVTYLRNREALLYSPESRAVVPSC